MTVPHQLEFFLLRYVPHAVQDEFVNIGVLLVDEHGFADVRFTRDWRRVFCLDPGADVEYFQALERNIRAQLQDAGTRAEILYRLQDVCSNMVQITQPKGCYGTEPAQELDSLARMYLESRAAVAVPRAQGGRRRIVAAMRTAFEREGVWELMRKEIAAEKYTYKGDPLKIDCAYRPNGVIKMFHGVSLTTDVDAAKVLAFSYPQLRAGILREENATASLTAVVEDALDRTNEGVLFALGVMQNTGIGLLSVSQLPVAAEEARRDLRV